MSPFLIAASLLLLAVLALLLWPLWRQPHALKTPAEAPALHILREQRAELDTQLASGQIDAAAHAEGLDELARRALAEAEAPASTPLKSKPRRGWAIVTGLTSALLAVGLYLILGNPAALDPANRAAPAVFDQAQIDAMVSSLAARVAANPDDIEGLRMLGRSYMVLGRFKEAAGIFAQLAAKLPQNARVLADWADALGSAQGGLAGEPEKLVVRALQLDPDDTKALALAGSLAFDKADYASAIRHLEKMATQIDPTSEIGQSVQAMLAEARQRAANK